MRTMGVWSKTCEQCEYTTDVLTLAALSKMCEQCKYIVSRVHNVSIQ